MIIGIIYAVTIIACFVLAINTVLQSQKIAAMKKYIADLEKVLDIKKLSSNAIASTQAMVDSFKPDILSEFYNSTVAKTEKKPKQNNSESIWSLGDVIHCETCGCMVKKDLAIRGESKIKNRYPKFNTNTATGISMMLSQMARGDDSPGEEFIFTPYYCKRCAPKEAPDEPKTSGSTPWPDPTLEMMKDPRFDKIWKAIKKWDIANPAAYCGYSGATGNHIRAILEALDANEPTVKPE